MKSKLNTSKKTAVVLLGAGAIAITGIAFGSWVISETQGGTINDQITVEAAKVIDESLRVTNIVVSDGAVRFDAPADDSEPPIIYGNDDGSGEDLVFGFSFDIQGALSSETTVAEYFEGFTLNMSIDEGPIQKAVASSQIVSPIDLSSGLTVSGLGNQLTGHVGNGSSMLVTATSGQSFVCSAKDATTLHVDANLSFKWGDCFGGVNPSKYITTSSHLDSLDSIKSILSGLAADAPSKITVTITPNRTASN